MGLKQARRRQFWVLFDFGVRPLEGRGILFFDQIHVDQLLQGGKISGSQFERLVERLPGLVPLAFAEECKTGQEEGLGIPWIRLLQLAVNVERILEFSLADAGVGQQKPVLGQQIRGA